MFYDELKKREIMIAEVFEFDYKGNTYRYTSNAKNIDDTQNTLTYEAKYIKRGNITQELNLEIIPINIEIEEIDWLKESYLYSEDFNCRIYLCAMNNSNEFYYKQIIFNGKKNNVFYDYENFVFSIDLVDKELVKLQKDLLSFKIQKACNNILYDSNCGLNKENFKYTFTVSGINKDEISISGVTQEDNYFYLGTAKFGEYERLIIFQDSTKIVVQKEFPQGLINIGDNIDIYLGCDKKAETCYNKFSNIEQYNGFIFMPEEII